ncbi:hypothetical protein I6A81_21390 [Frankia sp. CN7]|nr:hypothetical protein [Frankia nepalensis]
MAGSHAFAVPDEKRARALAEALAAHGFALVTGNPSRLDHGWMVVAYDEGPYPADAVGHRAFEMVGRQAVVLARQHLGSHSPGGIRGNTKTLAKLRPTSAAIFLNNPGARPPLPAVLFVDAPPPLSLELSPDHVEDVAIDLSGLDEIPWADLDHAFGKADDVPVLIRLLTDPRQDWAKILDELFGDNLLHQGTCYSATAPALPFLTRLITSGALPSKRRLDLYCQLLWAAGQGGHSLTWDADLAVVQGRPPAPAKWTQEVHATVGEQVPALLARWDVEPPANQAALAFLAGLYPHHAASVIDQIASLAERFEGTQPGVYLDLAVALARADDNRALAIASDIAMWHDDADLACLDSPAVSTAVKAGCILVDGALHVLSDAG